MRVKAPWSAVDFVLLTALLVAVSVTIVLSLLSTLSGTLMTERYEIQKARVSNVSRAVTRCDKCVNDFVSRLCRSESCPDDDDEDGEDGGDGGLLVEPNWWSNILNDPDEQQRMEDSCPLVTALYVIVTYTDMENNEREALLHENVYTKRYYPKLSFSPCERTEHGSESRRRRQRRSPSGSSIGAIASRYGRLLQSGEPFKIYVDPHYPYQAVEENPQSSLWKSKPFVVLFVITVILAIAFIIRRVVVHKKSRRVGEIAKKELYAVGYQPGQHPVMVTGKDGKEKDPAILGEEAVYAVTYDVGLVHDKTLMSRALGEGVNEKEQEAAVLPPVYSVHIDAPPPSYSSLDLSKY